MSKSYRFNDEESAPRRIKTVTNYGKVAGMMEACGQDPTRDPKLRQRLRFIRRKGGK